VHGSLNLAGNDPFYRGGADFFIEAFLAKPAAEGRSDIFFFMIPSPSFVSAPDRFPVEVFSAFFHEAMQEHHTIFFNAENHAGDTTVRQAASDFPHLAAERTHQRHTNRPRIKSQ